MSNHGSGSLWDPTGSGKTVIRAGAGIAYDTIRMDIHENTSSVSPFRLTVLQSFAGPGSLTLDNPYQGDEKVGWVQLPGKTESRLYVLTAMRGKDTQQSAMFSYLSPEDRVPADHPLRPVRLMADIALEALSPVFNRMYVAFGRPSIAPEKLLRALAAAGSVHDSQ